jgi:methionyl-tRNA synthetase
LIGRTPQQQTIYKSKRQSHNGREANGTTKFLATPSTSFDDGVRPFHITTPIYYVNDKPHIGHAYTSVACDVLARYMRLSGRRVFFQTGTDEHGEKVQLSAQSRGMPVQEFVDATSQNFRDMGALLNLQTDCFLRTTDPRHRTAVQVL